MKPEHNFKNSRDTMSSPVQNPVWNLNPTLSSSPLARPRNAGSTKTPFTFDNPLPVLGNNELGRLDEVLAISLNFQIFDKTLTLNLGLLLTFLPPSDIQIVGGTLKYILGTQWLNNAGQTAFGINGSNDDPQQFFGQNNSDIDIRIWPHDRSKEPEHHASQFLFNIATYFHTFRDLKQCFTHEQILNELRKHDGPFSIFESRIKFNDSEITHETFLASYKKNETELDLYFARVLEDPITLIDEDIYLPIGDYVNHHTVTLTPSGSALQGWSAVESIVRKVIVPVKTDHHAWLRAMRREIQGYTFAENKEHCFTFAPGTNFEKLIHTFLNRRSIATAEERFILLLNMVAFKLRNEIKNDELVSALNKIDLKEVPQGFLGDLYQAAKKVGWLPLIVLLRLTQQLDESRRWRAENYYCNLSISTDEALDLFVNFDVHTPEFEQLAEILGIDFSIDGHAGLLFRITKEKRDILCEKLVAINAGCVTHLFSILLKINYREAQEFMKRHYQKIITDTARVDFVLQSLGRQLPLKVEGIPPEERVTFFIRLALKLRVGPQNEQSVNNALDTSLMALFEAQELTHASAILQQVIDVGPFNRNPSIWMHLLAHIYVTNKSNDNLLKLMQLANQWQIWCEGPPYEEATRFFTNCLHLMIQQADRELWLPIAHNLVDILLRSRIPDLYKNELRAIQSKVVQRRQQLEIESAHIPEDISRIQAWPDCEQPQVETLFRLTILPLMGKINDLPQGSPGLNGMIDTFHQFLLKEPQKGHDILFVAEMQDAFYSFALRLLAKEADPDRCRSLLYTTLDMCQRNDVVSAWLFHLLERTIVNVDDPFFIEWILAEKRQSLGCAFIHKLFDADLSIPASKLLKTCSKAFSDEMLLSFATKISLDFLFDNIPRSAVVLRTLSLNRIGGDAVRIRDLETFKSSLLEPPMTENKCDALIVLSPFLQAISMQAVEIILRNALKWPKGSLKVKIWLWYRTLYHYPLTRIESETKITKEMKDVHAFSIKLLKQLDQKDYPLLEEDVLKFIRYADMIQIIFGENGFSPEVIQFVRDDVISLATYYTKNANKIYGEDIEYVFTMLQAHSLGDSLEGEKFLQSNALMLNLTQKIVSLPLDPDHISASDLEVFLKGWQLLQNLVFRTEKNDQNLLKQIIKYLKASAPFCKDHLDRTYKDMIENYACCLLQLSHPFYNKFENAGRIKLAQEFLTHPVVVNGSNIESNPLREYYRLRIKQLLEPLTAEEHKQLYTIIQKLTPFNWRKVTPSVNGMLCWLFILHICWFIFSMPFQKNPNNETTS